jgi:hypothetical protein
VERAKVQAQVDCQLVCQHAAQPARGNDRRQLAHCQNADVLPVEHQVVVGNDERGWGKEIRERAEAEGCETLVTGSGPARSSCVTDSNQRGRAWGLYARGGLNTTLEP